jgi:general secretion pathway protein L
VELNVIPKKYVDPQLTALKKAGIFPQTVELLDDRPGPWVNVLSGAIANDDHKGTRFLNKFLCLLGLMLFGVAAALPFRNIELAITQTESDIQEARAGALEVNELRSEWTKVLEKQNSVNQMIDDHRSVTLILEELTRLIPDDTWLSRLDIKGETIRLQGESSAATSVIRIIENSSNFSGTRFQSPVTTNSTSGNDRFQIRTNNTQGGTPQVSSK